MLDKLFTTLQTWLPLILNGAAMTVLVSFCGLIIGFCGGIILGIFSCNKLKQGWWSWLISLYVLVVRGTPLYVQVLIVYYALPEFTGFNVCPFWAGVCALGLNSIAYITEIIRAGINAVPDGQWDAAFVLGYSPSMALALIIMPQTIKNILPALVNEVISVLKESSILATIGLIELVRVAINISAITLDPMSIYLGIGLIYLMLTTTIAFVAKTVEKKLGVNEL